MADPTAELTERIKRLERELAECRRREAQLIANERYFRSLFEEAPLPYQSLDQKGIILDVNRAWLAMLGYDKSEVIGMPVTAFLHPKWVDKFRENFPAFLTQGHVEGVEFKMVAADGRFVDVSVTGRISHDSEGKFRATHCLLVDMTEKKQAAQERQRIESQMRHVQKLESLGVLAGGIAHDFNNLLMVILGNSDLALAELSPVSPARENLLAIEKAARRSAELCKQMLAYAGKGRFVVQPLDLSQVVEAMNHMLEVSISKKNVLKFNLARNLPPVMADVSQVRQVLMNLVINATEAIGDKSGVISITTGAMECDRSYLAQTFVYEQQLPEGIYCYIEVADTGCGMSEEVKTKLFDPFFTTKFTGRGLGMSAVLGIMRGHKGAVKIYTEPERGTTVKVLFPAAPDHERSLPSGNQNGDLFKGKTVLLADDEETVRAVGKQMLERLGLQVITAVDGREAVALYRANQETVDLVILDLTMPHMDGEEAFRELRRIEPSVRVVLSSGYHEQEVTQRFTGKGLAAFIQKPYTLTALDEVLSRVFCQ